MSDVSRSTRKSVKHSRGQGNADLILVVVLVAVAAIGTIKVFGDQQRDLYGRSANELAGKDSPAAELGCAGGTCGLPWANCFVAGTKVLTADGLRNIEDVRRGDLVSSRNPDTGESGWKSVTETFITPDRPVMTLELASTGGATTQSLVVTPQHPFWVVDVGWREAGALTEGSLVATATGAMRVERVAAPETKATVFNFEVSDWHTYFVGDAAVLVHNPCSEEPGVTTRDGDAVIPYFPAGSYEKTANGHYYVSPRARNSIFVEDGYGNPAPTWATADGRFQRNGRSYTRYTVSANCVIQDCAHTAEEVMNDFNPLASGGVNSQTATGGVPFGDSDSGNYAIAKKGASGHYGAFNDDAAPSVGQAYVIIRKRPVRGESDFHVAGVVAVDGPNTVTLETSADNTGRLADPFDRGRDTKPEFYLQTIGGPKSFHSQMSSGFPNSTTVVLKHL